MDGTPPVAAACAALDIDECLRLLEHGTVGRIGLLNDNVPEILPVNYRWFEGAVVLRTELGDRLDRLAARQPVAFEIDEVSTDDGLGWSVLVRGRGEEVADPSELARLRRLPLRPWAPGRRDRYVRILPGSITGRRLRAQR